MDLMERETVIDSLTHLESYYQSRYEHYLAMATVAKENRERVASLLQDLERDETNPENYIVGASSINGQQNNGQIPGRISDNVQASSLLPPTKSQITPPYNDEADSDSWSKSVEIESNLTVENDSSAENQAEQMKQFMIDLSIAMSLLESVSNSDSGKTLHQNYLHKILNQEFERELSIELVELYLDEAINRGLIERDEFDRKCYIANTSRAKQSVSGATPLRETVEDGYAEEILASLLVKSSDDSTSNAEIKQNQDVDREIVSQVTKSRDRDRHQNSRLYDLPSSPKLKSTLFATIEQYINKFSPKLFSIGDVIDYLYPQKQQLNWSQNKKNKVRASISNVLGRKIYLGKHWSRIKPGVYQPLTSN